jgi:transcriptional regulator with XRE-family HTH domain
VGSPIPGRHTGWMASGDKDTRAVGGQTGAGAGAEGADRSLGAFLRARRGRVDPSDLGFPAHGRRRTPGLRREEVASLAGVSVEYLTRLEQGRSSHPSVEVLDALARALRLDREAHAHLRLLAGAAPPPATITDEVRPALVEAVEALAPKPAYLLSPRLDVLAATPAARALLGPPGEQERPSIPRWFFLDPRSRRYHVNWATDAAFCVAFLRTAVHPDRPDPGLDALVAELQEASADFRRWWDDHEVRPCASGVKVFDHPAVGRLSAAYESFPAADEGATLVLYRATGDERSRTAFELLTTVDLEPWADTAP